MTDKEIYDLIVEKTKDLKIKEVVPMTGLNQLCELLSIIQVTSATLSLIDFESKKEQFQVLFENYEPKKVMKNGKYLAQLNRVLECFSPQNPSPYKKLTQAIYLSARFLSHYDSLGDFRKEVYLSCKDENSTYQYLFRFRNFSSLSSLYFVKTCAFFEKSGLLDVPLVTKKAKEILLPLFGIQDENEVLYKKMISLCRKNNITSHELNCRIEAIPC